MGYNKVIYNGKTIIDLTHVTVTPETLAAGVTAYDAAGNLIVGTGLLATKINVYNGIVTRDVTKESHTPKMPEG